METLKIHKVIVRPETYDIISTDTAFYAFLGQRMYHAFDRLICDEDKERVLKKLVENFQLTNTT